MKIAATADLHWGIRDAGDAATRRLVAALHADPPDVLVVAGDLGAGREFRPCLDLFAGLACRKALVPGNHDVWTAEGADFTDSHVGYRERLPAMAADCGFHMLDEGPLVLDTGVALVGSMNWYDGSWLDRDALAALLPEWEESVRRKRFTRGRHNDGRFVTWTHDDAGFTRDVVERFARQLDDALRLVERAVVVTHHPPFRGLDFSATAPTTVDGHLWTAFTGNTLMEAVLRRHADRVAFAFCGHTHRDRETVWHGVRGYNVGGDYDWKRLLTLDWPAGEVTVQAFEG